MKESYTVKELIAALEKCPADYEVKVGMNGFVSLESVGIDHDEKIVGLFFAEDD